MFKLGGNLLDNVSLALAFTAGLFSFLSPCVLPLVPSYITFLTGSSLNELSTQKNRLSVLYKSFGFVFGFSIIFIIMGLSVTALGNIFLSNKIIFSKLSGILIIIFGIHTTGIIPIKILYSERRFVPLDSINANLGKAVGSIFIGMAFAAGWTPCVGPILASILLLAGNMNTLSKGILLLGSYSLGLAIPFICSALLISSFNKFFMRTRKYIPLISLLSGILLIITGILIFNDKLKHLSGYFNFFNGL